MTRRWLVGLTFVLLCFVGASAFAYHFAIGAATPIRVGLLHSQTGSMAISELPMLDAEILAIEELNAKGGLLGRPIEWVKADGKSDPRIFGEEARRLIDVEKVSVIFGCWTSACRKSVKQVVEQRDHLLIYSVAYEGLENSPHVFHVGATPNQQVIPAVSFAMHELKAKSFYFVGSPSVWSRTLKEIIKTELNSLDGTMSGESYPRNTDQDFDATVEAILKTKPNVIINTLEGDSNAILFRKLKQKGIKISETPVLSFGINEDEVRGLSSTDLAGSYSVGGYFQSLDRTENGAFVERFQSKYGKDRVTSDGISTAYNSVVLWSQAVLDSDSDAPSRVRRFLPYQSYNAPEGIVSVDRENFHAWRSCFVGKISGDGKIDVVWSLAKPIRPIPFPQDRSRDEWEAFLQRIFDEWGGNWTAPDRDSSLKAF